jgi:hypothetical protein
MTTAWIKKMRKSFKVGDKVTWGFARVAHVILEIHTDGVVVDNEGEPYFVTWNGYERKRQPTRYYDPDWVLRKA